MLSLQLLFKSPILWLLLGAVPLVFHKARWSRPTFRTIPKTVSSSCSSLSSWESTRLRASRTFLWIGGRPAYTAVCVGLS